MSYEVPAGPIRRSRRPIVVPPLIALAVLAVALIAGPPSVPRPSPSGGPAPTAESTPAPLVAGVTDCGELRALVCRDAVRAAQLALGSDYPAIELATAWRSLICGDNLDCPPSMLAHARPAGSVVFTFADTSSAWVNLVWTDVSSRRFEDGTEHLTAFVVRWFGPTY
jgi:hypothetical protein